MGLNELAKQQWDWVESVGWHNKTNLECLALVASEVGEAINECRNTVPTNKFGEELADIILRVLDLAANNFIDLEAVISVKMLANQTRGTRNRTF